MLNICELHQFHNDTMWVSDSCILVASAVFCLLSGDK